MAYFNNYYFPLNGPAGVDIQNRFVGDNSTPSNFFFQYSGFNGGNPVNSSSAVRKPELDDEIAPELLAPDKVEAGVPFTVSLNIRNRGGFALNGTQVRLTFPEGLHYISAAGGQVMVDGSNVIITLGRLEIGDSHTVQLSVRPVEAGAARVNAEIRSATVMPVEVDPLKVVVTK